MRVSTTCLLFWFPSCSPALPSISTQNANIITQRIAFVAGSHGCSDSVQAQAGPTRHHNPNCRLQRGNSLTQERQIQRLGKDKCAGLHKQQNAVSCRCLLMCTFCGCVLSCVLSCLSSSVLSCVLSCVCRPAFCLVCVCVCVCGFSGLYEALSWNTGSIAVPKRGLVSLTLLVCFDARDKLPPGCRRSRQDQAVVETLLHRHARVDICGGLR